MIPIMIHARIRYLLMGQVSPANRSPAWLTMRARPAARLDNNARINPAFILSFSPMISPVPAHSSRSSPEHSPNPSRHWPEVHTLCQLQPIRRSWPPPAPGPDPADVSPAGFRPMRVRQPSALHRRPALRSMGGNKMPYYWTSYPSPTIAITLPTTDDTRIRSPAPTSISPMM